MNWTEYDFGYDYAKFQQVQGETEPEDIEKAIQSTISIPDGDYMAMKEAGIKNPDARRYWQGYNARMNETKEAPCEN